MSTLFATTESNAVVSPCGLYRYHLSRTVSDKPGVLGYVLLNPSTADASQDDATTRRLIGFCQRFGYGRYELVNLYGLRSTDPRGLWTAVNPIGPDNDDWIIKTAESVDMLIVGWGNHGKKNGRGRKVLAYLDRRKASIFRLGPLTKQEQPNHPLFLRAATPLEPHRVG